MRGFGQLPGDVPKWHATYVMPWSLARRNWQFHGWLWATTHHAAELLRALKLSPRDRNYMITDQAGRLLRP